MIMFAVALLLSMVLCLLFGVPYIDFLRKKTIGQYILDVAPEAHAKKAGTPTTGGVFIIAAIIIASIITLLMAQQMDNSAWIIIITLLFMALAGFQDDYLKLKGHENKGLSPRGKLIRQILIALIPTVYAMQHYGTVITLGYKTFDLGILYPVFTVFVVTGASNAYNLTDGLDGLAASTGIPAFLACGLIAFSPSHLDIICTWPVEQGKKVPYAGTVLMKTMFEDFLKGNRNLLDLDAVTNGPSSNVAKFTRLGFVQRGGENYITAMRTTRGKIENILRELNEKIFTTRLREPKNVDLFYLEQRTV